MIRPRKMKQIEMTVLARDADSVIEYLGRRGIMHFSGGESAGMPPGVARAAGVPADTSAASSHIRETLDRVAQAAAYIGVELPSGPGAPADSGDEEKLPGEEEEHLADSLCRTILGLRSRESAWNQEKKKLEETVTEAKAFSRLNAPFSDLDQLSYLTLRVGRLDPRHREEL